MCIVTSVFWGWLYRTNYQDPSKRTVQTTVCNSHLLGLSVIQQAALCYLIYGVKGYLYIVNTSSLVRGYLRHDVKTSYDFICQVLKVEWSRPYQEAPTVRLPFIKDSPKPRKKSCPSRPRLLVKRHHGKGGLQSCKENRKSYLDRCVVHMGLWVCVLVFVTLLMITCRLLFLSSLLRLEC